MNRAPFWYIGSSKRTLPKILNHEQLLRVLSAIDDPYILMAVFLAFIAGLRISEICNLKKEHIDLGEKKIFVIQGKGRKDAVVDIVDDRFLPIIDQYLKFHKNVYPKKSYLFPGLVYNSKRISRATLLNQFTKAIRKTKLLKFDFETSNGHRRNNFNFHTLRHTYCTYLIKKGLPLNYVQKLMRHSSVEMTQRYTHITDVDMREKIDKIFNNNNQVSKINNNTTTDNMKTSELSPLELLKIKFVNDEIGVKEFQRKLKILQNI
ncbi:tyrosine-type recombinase/integrase [candidate division KSB1 bacterium]